MYGSRAAVAGPKHHLRQLARWPTAAVVYDAHDGAPSVAIDALRGSTSSLAGWSDQDTFFGLAERIDQDNPRNVLRAQAGRHLRAADPRLHAGEPGDPVSLDHEG